MRAAWPLVARVCGVALAIVAGAARPAAAGGPATWQVPAACGGSAAVVARIGAQVGRPLTDDEPVAIAVAIATEPGGEFAAVVDLVSVRGASRRELRGPDCAAVVDAVALVVAVALQAAAPAAVERAPVVVVVAPVPTRFLVGIDGGVAGGALPAAAPGAALGVVLARGRWRLELGGETYRARFAPSPSDATIGVDVGLLGGRLRGCGRAGPLRLCTGVAVARLEGRPVGLAQPSTESRRWSALTFGLGASSRLGGLLGRRFAVTALADGLVALDRPEFVLADDTRLHQPAAVGWRVAAGIELEIR